MNVKSELKADAGPAAPGLRPVCAPGRSLEPECYHDGQAHGCERPAKESGPCLDDELFRLYRLGCQDSFTKLYERNQEHLHAFLASEFNLEPQDADDLCQDIWLKVVVGQAVFRKDFRSWLFCLAKRRAIDFLRKSTREQARLVRIP